MENSWGPSPDLRLSCGLANGTCFSVVVWKTHIKRGRTCKRHIDIPHCKHGLNPLAVWTTLPLCPHAHNPPSAQLPFLLQIQIFSLGATCSRFCTLSRHFFVIRNLKCPDSVFLIVFALSCILAYITEHTHTGISWSYKPLCVSACTPLPVLTFVSDARALS